MDTEPPRLAFALASLAGSAFWGLHHVATTLLGGQAVAWADWVRVLYNVVAAILTGLLVAYFVAPAIAPMIPVAQLREPHALGFGIGAGAWEVAPFFLSWIRGRAAKATREKR